MTDLETPEQFADRQWSWLDREKLRDAIRSRDAAVRAEVWRKAAEHLERNARAQRNSTFPHTAEFAEQVAEYFRGCALASQKGGRHAARRAQGASHDLDEESPVGVCVTEARALKDSPVGVAATAQASGGSGAAPQLLRTATEQHKQSLVPVAGEASAQAAPAGEAAPEPAGNSQKGGDADAGGYLRTPSVAPVASPADCTSAKGGPAHVPRVLIHDDDCGTALDATGMCPVCRFRPDMQSTAFVNTEPSGSSRKSVPPEVHERGWQWRPVGDSAFAPPFGSVRVCRGCGCLVAGGPTACVRCAAPHADMVAALRRAASRVDGPARAALLVLGQELGDDAADGWTAGTDGR